MLMNLHGQRSLALDDHCVQYVLAYDAKVEAMIWVRKDIMMW